MAYQPKSYRKFLAGSVSAALVATAVGPVVANAASFSDVDPNSTHGPNILALADKGYIKGFQDGTFKPFEKISRGQAAKIFARILTDKGFKAPDKIEQVFDDVPLDAKDQELVKAAAIVKAAGVMTGSEGKLNPASNITRQQMAKVIVETFDLEKPADFKSQITDLDKADAWAREYIQTLEANGVTVVKEYRPKDNVTRGEFASFVKRAMDATATVTADDITAVKFVDENTLEVTFNGELKDVKKEDFSIEGVEIDSVSIKAAAAAESKTTVVVIKTKTKLEEGKTYTVAYKGKTTDKTKVEVPVVTPKVESVSAINANQIEVKFNKAVDKKSAETLTNYIVKEDTTDLLDGTAAKAELQADGKTVIVTLEQGYIASPAFNQKTLSVKVKNVKTADGSTVVPEYSTDVKVFDAVVPTVTDIRQVSPTEFDVVFSEPVTAASNSALTTSFRINNGAYSFSAKTRVDDAKLAPNVVRITTFAPLAEGEYTLTINDGITDYAGFKVNKTDKTFTVAKDTTAVTASVSKVSGNKVYVTFNKPVKNFDDSNVKFHLDYPSNDNFKATSVVANPEDEKGIIVTFNQTVTPGSHKLYVSYESSTEKQIEDAWGNKFAATAIDFTVASDTTAPVATKAEFNKTTGKIEVTFSEPVVGADALDAYELKDASGNKVNIIEISVKPNTDNLVYQLTPAKALEGNYTLKILADKITDASVEKNKLAETTLSLGVADATPPTVTGVTYGGASNKKVFIQYSEPMRTSGEGSVLDKSLYLLNIDGAGFTKLSDIEGATIALGSDNKSVIITLPNSITTGVTVEIGRVADAAGNFSADFKVLDRTDTLATATADAKLTVVHGLNTADDTTPAAKASKLPTTILKASSDSDKDFTAKVTSHNTVEFYLSGAITAVDASRIKVGTVAANSAKYENVTVTMADGETRRTLAKVTVTFPDNTFTTDATAAADLIVEDGAFTTVLGSTFDAAGGTSLTVADQTNTLLMDAAAPVVKTIVDAADYDNDGNFDEEVKDIVTNDTGSDGIVDEIVVTFSEPMATLSATGASARALVEVAGYKVNSIEIDSSNPDIATIAVEPVDAETASQKPSVKLTGLEDKNGNVIAATTLTAYDRVAAVVTSTELSNSNKTIRINFSEAMKAEDLVAANFTAAGLTIESFVKGSNNKYVIITFDDAVDTTDITVVNSLRDANGLEAFGAGDVVVGNTPTP